VRKLALRGLAARKLRTSLSALAVVLGVAMIVGTYVLTDQITNAFEDITAQGVEGIDVIVTPDEAFSATMFTEPPAIDDELVERIEGVEGVAAAEGQITAFGQLVVGGETVDTFGAPALVAGDASEQFDPSESVSGRDPERPGEAAVLAQNAEDQGIEVGDRIEVVTRRGLKPLTVVGTFEFGEGGSALGGTTFVEVPTAQVQRWFDLRGKVSTISVIAEPGTDPAAISERVGAVLPTGVRAQTAEENAGETADEINDQIGSFLTPALLAMAGAAVLVGAFIIFNTFSITVAQRMREFAMLRALGATRRQVLAVVAGEALLLAVIATAIGFAAGIGIAVGLGALFDAVGVGIPRADVELKSRTILIGVVVGIAVTALAALVPAVRATRVAPVAAMSGVEERPSRRGRRRRAIVTAVLLVVGLALTAQGLFGGGAATSKLSALGGGAVAIFVGVAMSARYYVRPLASAIGLPVEKLFKTPGRLARENAMRNPARTAITSAALMVGLALVVFVAVFTAGLKTSFTDQIDELVKADLFVTSETFGPISDRAVETVSETEGVGATLGVLFEQLEVNGEKSNIVYDVVIGGDPDALSQVYAFDWIDGDDSLLDELSAGEALIEEQFANAHDIAVGDSYDVVTPSGREEELTAIGIYRDPTILQGSIASPETLAAISPARDSMMVLVSIADEADAGAVQDSIQNELDSFPGLTVESKAQFQETTAKQLDQIVYLLYALLAMSVVISLFGIANSLFLSIYERTHEIGVLRAIGTTATQVKRVIRYESVITAVIGGLLGIVVGIVFALLATASLSEFGLGLSIPVGQLAVLLVVAIMVGVIGAIAPSRRAAHIDVLEAIREE
jgi:putative ABC transport system permease protein